MRSVPMAAPPMIISSIGWSMTRIGPPAKMKPTNTLKVTTTRPTITSIGSHVHVGGVVEEQLIGQALRALAVVDGRRRARRHGGRPVARVPEPLDLRAPYQPF